MVRKKVMPSSSKIEHMSDEKVQKLLVENFIVLQKVMTDMTVKFDNLSNNMSKLLNLFESSAKSFSEKQPLVTKEDKDFLEKLDKLLEQNKTIAKGLTMMEERARDRISPTPPIHQMPTNPMMQNTSMNIPQENQTNFQNRKSKILPRF